MKRLLTVIMVLGFGVTGCIATVQKGLVEPALRLGVGVGNKVLTITGFIKEDPTPEVTPQPSSSRASISSTRNLQQAHPVVTAKPTIRVMPKAKPSPTAVQPLIQIGSRSIPRQALQARDLKSAAVSPPICSEPQSSQPVPPEAWMKGLAAFRQCRFESAAEQFDRAARENRWAASQRAIALLYGGMTFYYLDQEHEAKMRFREALNLKADLAAPAAEFSPDARRFFDQVKAGRVTEQYHSGGSLK